MRRRASSSAAVQCCGGSGSARRSRILVASLHARFPEVIFTSHQHIARDSLLRTPGVLGDGEKNG